MQSLSGVQKQPQPDQPQPSGSTPAARYTILIALLCSLCNILLGYDIGIMSVAHDFIREDLHLDAFRDGFQVGILNAAGGVGGLLTGELADTYGRRGTMMVAAVLFFVGSVTVTVAQGFWMIVIGRIITGLGTGVGALCSPLLLAELTSPKRRGMIVGWTEVINNVGICLGFVVGFYLSGLPLDVGWRVMIGLGALPPFAIMLALFVIPESPRWLMMRGREEEAKEVVLAVSDPDEYDEVMENCRKAVSVETAPWSEIICPGRLLRSIAVVGWGVPFLSQATGTESAVYFSPDIMADAGIKSPHDQYEANILVGIVKASLLLVPMFLIDSQGRKPVLLSSVAGQAITACCLAIAFWLAAEPWLVLMCLFAYIGTFSLGLSTLAFVIPAEVFPLKFRARATGVAWFLNRTTSSLVAITFLPACELVSVGGVFFFYSVVAFLGLFYVYWCVPETKNLSLEDVQELFAPQSDLVNSYDGERGENVT